jgi:hypothetical protein
MNLEDEQLKAALATSPLRLRRAFELHSQWQSCAAVMRAMGVSRSDARNKRREREIEFLKPKTCGEYTYSQPLPKKSQKQGDYMRKHYFLSSLVIFVAGFVLSAVVDGRRLISPAQGALSNPALAEVAAQTTRQPSTVQRWEYQITRISSDVVGGVVRPGVYPELNQLGGQGFEVCGVTEKASDGSLTIVLRRPR